MGAKRVERVNEAGHVSAPLARVDDEEVELNPDFVLDDNVSIDESVVSDDDFSDSEKGVIPDSEDDDDENAAVISGVDDRLSAARRKNLAELSDSEEDEDEKGTLLRVGNIPRQWYDHLEHIGYNVDGKPVTRRHAMDAIDRFLQSQDPAARRTVYDEDNDELIELSKEDMKMLRRIRQGTYAHAGFNESSEDYSYVAYQEPFPIGNAFNPPKNRFVPSKWEQRVVAKYIRLIQNGWVRPPPGSKSADQQQPQAVYLMWGDDGNATESIDPRHRPPPIISAPKPKLPGHVESYNPPDEYLPQNVQLNKKTAPYKFERMRHVPGYDRFVNDRFERCLDLYLCPRTMKKRLQVTDPNSLLPELPKPSTLRPFPSVCALEFVGHSDRVRRVTSSPCGQWLASGDEKGLVMLWEVSTGRCLKSWSLPGNVPVLDLAFNPEPCKPMLAVLTAESVRLWATNTGSADDIERVRALLTTTSVVASSEEAGAKWTVEGVDSNLPGLTIVMSGILRSISWHRGGDYLATVAIGSSARSVLIHRLSAQKTQAPFSKAKGDVQCVVFHPSRPVFLVATKRHVRIYDLQKQAILKKLQCPARWISSIQVHPSGDHVLVGSYDRRVCWYDLDLSSQPFKTLKYHKKAVRNVAYHRTYPLFASCSDDGSVHVFHGRVFDDLRNDPLIVPVKILRAHAVVDDYGVLDTCFHPSQPWLFTAGVDGKVKLFTP